VAAWQPTRIEDFSPSIWSVTIEYDVAGKISALKFPRIKNHISMDRQGKFSVVEVRVDATARPGWRFITNLIFG
jgi:hypothetical protein